MAMEIPKEKILDLLKQRGESDKARAGRSGAAGQGRSRSRPGILEKIGIDPKDLAGNLGGLGEKLGL